MQPTDDDARATSRSLLLLFAAVTVAYAVWFYRDLLFLGRVQVFRDNYTLMLPTEHVVRVLSRWSWPPLWNPFEALGKPLGAEPVAAVYYPFNWLLRRLPEPLGFNGSIVFHHLWAAAGAFLLLRRGRLSAPSAALGALLFAFGGMCVSMDSMINGLRSVAWLPWAALAFETWCERQSFAALAALALALGMTFLGGYPEVVLFANLLFAAIALERSGTDKPPGLARAAAGCLLANLLAVALAAVHAFPLLEYLAHSVRAGGLSAENVVRYSLRPLGLFAFLVPRRFTDAGGRFHETAALWEGDLAEAPWAPTLYLGPVLILLIASGGRSAFRSAWWTGVGFVFALLALGDHLPGFRWLVERAALLRVGHFPEKLLLVPHALLAAGAAAGLESCLARPARFRTVAALAAAVGSVAGLVAALVARNASFPALVLAGDLRLLAVGSAAIAGLALAGRSFPRGAALGFVLLAAADLYRVNGVLLPTVDWMEAVRVSRATSAMRKGDDLLRIYANPLGRADVPPFPEGFLQERNLLLMQVASLHSIANVNTPAPINLADQERFERLIETLPRERVAPLLGSFNTAYVTSAKELRYPGFTLVQEPRSDLEAFVYRIEGARPRAFVARSLYAASGPEDALAHLQRAEHPADHVAVDAADIPAALPQAMAGSVRLDSYLAERVELSAQMQTPGLVFLADTYYPGWRATIDGAPAPVVRANYFGRGVFVPAGEHRLAFRYEARSQRLGALVSIAAGVGVLLGLALTARRKGGGRAREVLRHASLDAKETAWRTRI